MPRDTESATHYATLGLGRDCDADAIRKAYRLLSKANHPDLNASAPESLARTQAINEAYAVLSNPARRAAYDQELAHEQRRTASTRAGFASIRQDAQLTIRELVLGTTVTVHIRDPANGGLEESYPLEVPAGTVPGARFRITREAAASGAPITIRVKLRPDRIFKAKGSDLRCDLRISARRALDGGDETIRGPMGNRILVHVPAGVTRGQCTRIAGEGLPTPRGGRGDLMVRIMYRPDVRIERRAQF